MKSDIARKEARSDIIAKTVKKVKNTVIEGFSMCCLSNSQRLHPSILEQRPRTRTYIDDTNCSDPSPTV